MIIRACLCIPTYNNPESIASVVKDGLETTQFPILIVDDGSDVPVETLLATASVTDERVSIVRHPSNLGKGRAIQSAFKYAVEKGFTHLITMDGDGQHFASEVSKLVAAMKLHPWEVIIGNRKLSGDSVPKISKFGRKFSNFWVKYETDQIIADSQSGFRIYPLFFVQTIHFWTKRFDFEIEILIRLMWRGVPIREIEIDVYYPPPLERVSHFDKLWDNVRITLLNVLLITLTLLKSGYSPLRGSVAIAVGVWIGSTPLYGLHAFIAAFLSVICRLNFVYLLLGTQVSLPPFVPLLVLGSVKLGKIYGTNWVFGSLILGSLLAPIAFFISFGIMSLFSRKKKAAWTGKTRGGKFGNGLIKVILKNLNLNVGYFCLYFIIPYFYMFSPKARKAGNEYWKNIAPAQSYFNRQWSIIRQMHQFGRILMDRLYQSFHSETVFNIESEGAEHLKEAVKKNCGLILLGAHIGGWDLAARTLKSRAGVENFSLVQYEAEGATFPKMMEKSESERLKMTAINQKSVGAQPVFNIRESLLQGQVVGFMGDRPTGNHYELVLFMGKLAAIDTTPFRVSASCQALILFTFGFKVGPRKYQFYASEARAYQHTGSENKALTTYKWVQEFSASLETHLKKYPHQWFNFYPLWSTRPSNPDGVSDATSRHYLFEDLKLSNKDVTTTPFSTSSV